MGRKKKPFIDKKKAQTFSLVPRSQKDPLSGDAHEPQYVLKPSDEVADPNLTEEDRLQEQHKYGIYYEDDYDYLQHLKEPGTAVMEPSMVLPGQGDSGRSEKPLHLPKELFGSEVTVEGHLEKVLPVIGPQPHWDPDIVAALQAAEESNDVCEDFEDDFVLLANGGQAGIPVYVTKNMGEDDVSDEGPWWMGRGDFDSAMFGGEKREEDDGEGSDVAVDADSAEERVVRFKEKKQSQFTDFSMTSSVVPRSETLTLLDDRFEGVMTGYDDAQLGAPEEEEADQKQDSSGLLGHQTYDQMLLEAAAEDFEKNFQDQLYQLDEEDEEMEGSSLSDEEESGCDEDRPTQTTESSTAPSDPPAAQTVVSPQKNTSDDDDDDESVSSGEESSDGSDGDHEREKFISIEVQNSKPQWDCESILSTYSNLYNHPTKISMPKSNKKQQITLSAKTGMPVGVISGPSPKEEQYKQASISRPRNESKDDKKMRKQALKEERRQRRADKKATKLAFKSEELKQVRAKVNQTHTAAVA